MKSLSFSILLINLFLLFQLIAAQPQLPPRPPQPHDTEKFECSFYNLITNENVTECCSLSNVKCNEMGSIISLDLMNRNLKTLSPEVGKFINLEYLDLENNQLTDLPVTISFLPKLKFLYLIKNQLQTVPLAVTRILNLEDLDLEGNNITSLPEELYNMQTLKNLVLNSNKIGSISPSIGKLVNLEKLYLSDVGLKSLPDELFKLDKLVKLTVSKNDLSSISNKIFNLNLKELYIYDNPHLSMKIINFKTSPLANCDFRNINVICYQSNTCSNLKDMKEDDLKICSNLEVEEIQKEMESENKSNLLYILIFSFLGILLLVLLVLSCLVIKNLFSDRKKRHYEGASNYSGSQQKYPSDYRYSDSTSRVN